MAIFFDYFTPTAPVPRIPSNAISGGLGPLVLGFVRATAGLPRELHFSPPILDLFCECFPLFLVIGPSDWALWYFGLARGIWRLGSWVNFGIFGNLAKYGFWLWPGGLASVGILRDLFYFASFGWLVAVGY